MSQKENWFDIEKIDNHTYAISEYGHWENFHSYLLLSKNSACLIDTGLGIGNIKEECRKLTDNEISVITTHVHWDHIGGHKYFEQIAVHRDDVDWLINGIPIPEKSVHDNLLKKPLEKEVPAEFDIKKYKVFCGQPSRVLEDGEEIKIGNRTLKVIHTPGHSPGHICLFEKDKGYLFSGDLIYKGTLYAFFESTNPVDYAESVNKVALTNGIKKIFPSHNQLSLDVDFLEKVNSAFKEIRDNGDLKHGTGLHRFDDFNIRL